MNSSSIQITTHYCATCIATSSAQFLASVTQYHETVPRYTGHREAVEMEWITGMATEHTSTNSIHPLASCLLPITDDMSCTRHLIVRHTRSSESERRIRIIRASQRKTSSVVHQRHKYLNHERLQSMYNNQYITYITPILIACLYNYLIIRTSTYTTEIKCEGYIENMSN